jgi:hypothetical protein
MAAEVHHHVWINRAAGALLVAGLLAASCAAPAVPASPAATSPTVATAPAAPAASAPNRVAPDIANRALAARVRDTARTDVAICLYVDPSTGLNADAARILLQDSVDALVRQGYTALGARSVPACPQVPLFLRTNTVHPKNSGSGPVAPAPIVSTPSPFLLFVAVTTPARIATIFGGSTIRRGAEEAACPGGGDNCLEVTSSIYTDPATFADAALRQTLVLDGLGLLGAK